MLRRIRFTPKITVSREPLGAFEMTQPSADDALSPSKTGYVTRPGIVTFVCITNFISIAVYGFISILFVIGQPQLGGQEILLATFLIGALGFYLAIVLGLWHAKNWARISYVVIFPLLAVSDVLLKLDILKDSHIYGDPYISQTEFFFSVAKLIILTIFSVLLFRPKSSAYFKGIALAPIDPGTGLEFRARNIVNCPSCGKEIYSTLVRCHHCDTDLNPNQPMSHASA